MDSSQRRARAKMVGTLMRHFRERHSPEGRDARLSQEGLLDLMARADQAFGGAYDRSTVSKWETGKALPSRERLAVFGQALSLSAAEIVALIQLAHPEPSDEDAPARRPQALQGHPGAGQGASSGSSDVDEMPDGGGDCLPLHTAGRTRFPGTGFLSRRSFVVGAICILASIAIAMGVVVGTGRLAFSGDSLVFSIGGRPDQKVDFAAEVQDVWLSPNIVRVGESADIKARFKNLSPPGGPYGGEATFDVAIAVRPPSGPEIRFLWNNAVFPYNKVETYEKLRYTFDQAGTYTIYAEVFSNRGQENGWLSDDRFANLSETFVIADSSTETRSRSASR